MFSLASLLSYWYAPNLTEWGKTSGLIESVIIYIIINPVYIGAIGFLSSKYHLRGFIASLFTIVALDIQSLPHVVVDGVTQDPTTYLFLDSIFYRNFGVGLFVLYVILPISLMIIAYELVSPGAFVKTVRRYSG